MAIPAVLPARAVRSVSCSGCGRRYEVESVTEVRSGGITLPALPSLSFPRLDPTSRAWQIASVPIAAGLVIGGLLLLQGDDDPAQRAPTAAPGGAAAASAGENGPAAGSAKSGGGEKAVAEVTRGAHYSLALPTGWEKIDPPAGATFAAALAGEAEITLWIEEDAGLDFPAFIEQSLEQMRTLAPDPRVVSRIPGPTPESTVVRLAADAPAGQPTYEVLLRAAGPYRYYLALTTYPNAGRAAADGVDLIANSLTPEVEG